jgi:hypothetical protein
LKVLSISVIPLIAHNKIVAVGPAGRLLWRHNMIHVQRPSAAESL